MCWCCLLKTIKKVSPCLSKLQLARVGAFFWNTGYILNQHDLETTADQSLSVSQSTCRCLYKLVLFVIQFLNICVQHVKQTLLARLDALGQWWSRGPPVDRLACHSRLRWPSVTLKGRTRRAIFFRQTSYVGRSVPFYSIIRFGGCGPGSGRSHTWAHFKR